MGAIVNHPGRRAAAAPQAAEERNQYLRFLLGADMFAIGILSIKEIIEYGELTEVPLMPGFIRGVINLRGAVVPVVDLSARFGRDPGAITRKTCIVIIEVEADDATQVVGVVVDSVSEVLEIAAADIEPAPSFGTRIRADFIAGMAKAAGKFVIILDVGRVLSLDDLAMLREADPSNPPLLANDPA